MNARFEALKEAGRKNDFQSGLNGKVINSESFGKRVFSRSVMQKMLPREVYKSVLSAMDGNEQIKPEYANTIALAVKEWAMAHGATHYCHWFQPLTGSSAEKHDSFIDWDVSDKVIEKFDGKQLIQSEPDASSFPSGGLRNTYEARGYTGWDPSSPIFLWKAGDGITLCIPSVFFSWTGNVLDSKIPLLRSDDKINKATSRLLTLTGLPFNRVYSTLGLEQEYFVIDRTLRNLRPDLVLLGKTVFGTSPPKGQELQDHYFGSVKDRILSFMCDFEQTAIELGIPVKTRHNEVAPSQYEVAPVFEKASTAIDHNILLMEIMRQVAQRHRLACLLHEKPFAGINGSGKHANWSLSTDTGVNLLDPNDSIDNQWRFLILLTAVIHAVHRHAGLLRASIGSASNDYRLGGHEAPPAIMSMYLGQELESLLDAVEEKGHSSASFKKGKYNLGLLVLPELTKDNTDRNRTSPFAFTGNKFEFRAVGSSSNPAFAITILNLIVAQSLNEILDEVEVDLPKGSTPDKDALSKVVLSILQKYIKQSKAIRFSGDNYSDSWVKEAQKRGIPNIKKSAEAFAILTDPKTVKLFEGVLAKEELASRQEILMEIYIHNMNIEVNLMLDLFKTQALPAVIEYQMRWGSSLHHCQTLNISKENSKQYQYLKQINDSIEKALEAAEQLEKIRDKGLSLSIAERGLHYSNQVIPKMEQLREAVDHLETIVEDRLWPMPKYRELLFIV